MTDDERVFVIDDDAGVRSALEALITSTGIACTTYDRGARFLEGFAHAGAGCILSDVIMPQMTGLQLLHQARQREIRLPIVLLTGHADVDVAVSAFRGGAFDFLEKPFSDTLLLDMLQRAIDASRQNLATAAVQGRVRQRLACLTSREREIVPFLVGGSKNKEIARELAISHRTVERHRQNVLQKLGLRSVVELATLTR